MEEKVLYEELTPDEFDARISKAPIAYLPLGTLEWHGRHLPLGSDGLQSKGFFVRLAREVGGIVLPMLFLGPDIRQTVGDREYYGMDTIGYEKDSPAQLAGSAYWIEEDLYLKIIEALLKQLKRAGFKIVVAHGHGPSTNQFRTNIEKWSREFDLKLFVCWREDESDGLGIQTDHAAANETSLMMAMYPDLVRMENLDANPETWPLAVAGMDPRIYASPERGIKAIETQMERMKGILSAELKKCKKHIS
jgi:creatinine amidohydrolase